MEFQHVNIKIYVEGDLKVDPVSFIEVFHGWIQDQVLDELLIDVADYRHVPAGPGVMLVGHEADFSMDHTDDRYGLLYNRKAPLGGNNDGRFGQALRSAAKACELLETRFKAEGLKFSRQEFELFINDRALAPNTTETYQACKPELEVFLKRVFGHDEFKLEHLHSDPRNLFGVHVKVSNPFDWATILESA